MVLGGSRASVASAWVEKEVNYAASQKIPILLVCLEEDVEWPRVFRFLSRDNLRLSLPSLGPDAVADRLKTFFEHGLTQVQNLLLPPTLPELPAKNPGSLLNPRNEVVPFFEPLRTIELEDLGSSWRRSSRGR